MHSLPTSKSSTFRLSTKPAMPFFWPSKSITPDDRDSSPGDDHASSSSSSQTARNTDGLSNVASSSTSSSSQISTSSLPSNSLRAEENATVSEPWTRIFPEAYGIRKAIEDSPFRWCVRESSLWAVATGTVMGM